MRIAHWLLGCVDVLVPNTQLAAFFNVCRSGRAAYTPLPSEQEGDALFRMRADVWRHMQSEYRLHGVEATVRRVRGLPRLLSRYVGRVGLWVGALLFVGVLYLGSSVVWDVRIDGGSMQDTERVRATLAECGLSVGTWLPTLDTDKVESRLLLSSDEVAWVSVNVKGTVAYVQLRELLKPERQQLGEPQNLVASCDGTVEEVELLGGEAAVSTGEVVRQGQLLISGVIDTAASGYRVTAAKGRVLARTEHTLTVEIGRQSEQKVYTERQMGEKMLIFFGKTIKLSKNSGNVVGKCDTIKKTNQWTLPDGRALPVAWQTIEYRYYEQRCVTLEDDELLQRARATLNEQLLAATQDALLLSKQIDYVLSEQGILMVCRYRCLENIAVPLPFEQAGK